MKNIDAWMESIGYRASDPQEVPSSPLRFPDGGQYRIEIPSTEGPGSLATVIEEAKLRKVPVHRVSQGSGIMLLTDSEIIEMMKTGKKQKMEVNLFLGPRASWDTGAQAVSVAGKSIALSMRGANQLAQGVMDTERAVQLGCRSILISDIGSLTVTDQLRKAGKLPKNLIIKTSVMMAPANPASAKVLQDLGADTINVPSDLSLGQIASIRAVTSKPIDFYVEAPDNIGGFIRYYDIPELIRVAAPIYLKFGLRNSPDIYPSGTHLENTVIALSRERVRRAEIACEFIERLCPKALMSPVGAKDLGIPEPS